MDADVSPVAVTPPASRTRRRARQACLACHQRKRKCDVKRPCSMCKAYGYRCEYPKDDRPSAYFVEHMSPVESNDALGALGTLASVAQATSNAMSPTRTNRESRSRSPVLGNQGILDPFKSRYMSQNSAVAFPRALGFDLQSTNPPSLHSFGWNCGVRSEEVANSHPNLLEIISFEELSRFSDVYFNVVHPIFAMLDRKEYMQRCETYWNGASRDIMFSAIIASVVALGSLFSLFMGHTREAEIVSYAKGVLDDPVVIRLPSTDQLVTWVLRTVYLRATTRPHVAWLASSVTVHLAEAIGLHHETDSVLLTTGSERPHIERNQEGAERGRRIFWCVWSINALISYEYGRSNVVLNHITCNQPKPTSQDFTSQVVQLAHIIPRDSNGQCRIRKAELQEAMGMLLAIPDENAFISLTKADLCFCFYRRLRALKQGIDKSAILNIIAIGNTGAEAACQLAQNGRPWWNVLGSVFQYICVLLAIDTAESLSYVSNAMEKLEEIVQLLRTHLAFEALTTAKVLLRDSAKKKKRELALLEVADTKDMTGGNDLDINWDELFDPSSNLFLMS